jgi:hypothetical protein
VSYNAAGLRLLVAVALLLFADRMPADGDEETATRDAGTLWVRFITWISAVFFLLDLFLDLHHKGVL